MLDIDRKILTIDKAICRHLAEADYSNRGMISQDILSHLRNLVEHLMLKCYAGSNDIDNTYAVSIHKAQGLEYRSVKIVITDEVDEMISHSIFYTAITRARERLKIYWTPEVENKVLSNMAPMDRRKDVGILRKFGL